jgi:hypothetical protein
VSEPYRSPMNRAHAALNFGTAETGDGTYVAKDMEAIRAILEDALEHLHEIDTQGFAPIPEQLQKLHSVLHNDIPVCAGAMKHVMDYCQDIIRRSTDGKPYA